MNTILIILLGISLYKIVHVQMKIITLKLSSLKSKNKTTIKPVQFHNSKRYLPININTQGIDHYQQIGLLYDGHITLPLLGRRVHNGSNKWNYYSLTNDNIALKIPLSNNGRACMERNGCDELYADDTILIPEYNNSKFKIKMYDNSPRYIPY